MPMNDDDLRGPVFELGRLHARVENIEVRQDKHDQLLATIDGKLDEIQTQLTLAVGARQKAASLIKYTSIIVAMAASLVTAVVGTLHFWGH